MEGNHYTRDLDSERGESRISCSWISVKYWRSWQIYMGQCVSRKAGAVIAASGQQGSPSYRIMEKPTKAQNDNKSAAKRATPYTRGTAISFGFRRRPNSGIPMPIASYPNDAPLLHPRSKSAGPEQDRRREEDHQKIQNVSGRSTPRLVPPKKEASGIAVRINRFGFRQPQARYTNKVGDICSNHEASHYNQEKSHQQQLEKNKPSNKAPTSKLRPSPVNPPYNNNNPLNSDVNRRMSGIPEPISKYTLHTSHLPLPQYAVRMNDANSKVAKTVANQNRKVSTASKGSSSSKEGSGTEDSGVGSQLGCLEENDVRRGLDYLDNSPANGRRGHIRPRNLRMVVNGKSFDVRDVDDDSTVTEISVIPLPKTFVTPNLNTGLVRERTTQYQRILNKDNRYNDSTTSMSTTSSEGYDEGLGEEKVYKDRSHSEKIPSIKSDFSPPSSDDPEYGHGEAMADEYSLSSSDECRVNSNHHLKTISNAAKSGSLPKSTLRSVLLTIEDPAFAAVAATSTTLIDDETSPVDSLFDSPTASITQSDGKASRKECPMERSGNTIDDDSPGTPTNASNSLSLSEGREFFDDEIADQPGLTFEDTLRGSSEAQSGMASQVVTENSQTLVESIPKTNIIHGKSVENSPIHARRLSRAGSVDTLSPCESIASDDLMLDYERSDTSSYEDANHRLDSNPALQDLDEATILSELEAQGEEVMREWSSLLGAHQTPERPNSNATNNNNITSGINNNHAVSESGINGGRTSRLLRSRSGMESPRTLDSVRTRQVSSPLRPPRNIQSPSLDSGDEGSVRVERGTYQHMFQDIVSIKTMLLKLKRVLQEAETLNPFENSIKNGLFYNLNECDTTDASTSPGGGNITVADELADLRRQVVFLQGQLEDKDRTIQLLQLQMTKYQGINCTDAQSGASSMQSSSIKDTCNATTQTEKMRPVSAGPSLLQSLPQDGGMGPLVSWSDSWSRQRPPSLVEFDSGKGHCKPPSPPAPRPRQDETTSPSKRQNGFSERTPPERPSAAKGSPKSRDPTTTACKPATPGEVPKEYSIKVEVASKSCIPTPRKLTTPTLIPRAARAVSATGRSHNP
ncbi:uncharacterized protein LOC105702722 isoform X2 [Orussus abietinus]|uniref:uncharacterized protein LOC105702722 isoform X2 n=1 Tax=Orussus abietinus TaxID=222816 RepID=UPI0006269507|nr:uncharacterized protein LOC105702722 isoform X2 [Orussus abietinus]